ncbi:MAG: putative addiction module antidote protein [Rickettsiales bacterium]|jgi:probable addiction module antidote protein|nr:putative addiction module antidote protein [Rickettsiales bacterium]
MSVKLKVKTSKFDVAEFIKTEEDMEGYLNAAIAENSPTLLVAALNDIARIKSINKIAENIKVNRQGLYKNLNGKSKISFETIYKVVDSLGFKFSIVSKA